MKQMEEDGQVAQRGADTVEDDDKDGPKWGMLSCKPRWMQWVNTPAVAVFCICWFTLLQGFVVNGINNVNTSSIERRFDLPSSRVGLISSAYDISGAIFVMPITFLFGRSHHPRMLGLAALVMSLGSLVMSLPHFTTGTYDPTGGSLSDACDIYNNGTDALCAARDPGLKNYLYVFMLGQFLHGIGGTTLYSIGVVYIDDNVKTNDSPLYTGFKYGCSALGPAIGYIIGGRMLQVFVDFDVKDSSKISITPEDPRWVGAWWVSFFVASFLFISAFLMFLPYPRETPNAKIVRQERVSMAHNDGSDAITSKEGFGTSVRDLPLATWLLIKNPVNMFVTLAAITEGMLTSGFATFMPKYLQNQFGLTSGIAAIVGGMMSVPGAVGGQFAGGLIARCFKLKVKGMLRLCMCLTMTCAVFSVGSLLNCGVQKIAGLSVAYGNGSVEIDEINLIHPCNEGCNCNTQSYEPLCGSDGVQYFSPCHAGCANSYTVDKKKYYTDCNCIPYSNTSTWDAMGGKCKSDCQLLGAVLPFFFLFTFLTFCGTVPGVAVSLRCIPENQRAFGIGLKWMFIRFLGLVPGPIIFGVLFDNVCILWQNKCNERGSCWIYDSYSLSLTLFLFTCVIKIFSSFFFAMAHFLYSPPPEENITSGKLNGGLSLKTPGGDTIDSTKDEGGMGSPEISVISRERTRQTRL